MKIPYTHKEISWLSFNERVLQEAADPSVPLFERIKFLGIYSSNLDEFFRVRVATLKRLSNMGKEAKKITGFNPDMILKKIQSIVLEQNESFETIYGEILEALAKQKIYIIDEKRLNKRQGEFVRRYFQQEVRPKLIPIMMDQVEKFPEMREQFIYLAVTMTRHADSPKTKHAIIEVPTDVLPRFLILPQYGKNRYIILLDDIIRFNLEDIFSIFHFDKFRAYTVKLTRDAELDIDDDMSQSMIKKMSKSLKQRKGGNPVRFIYDAEIPDSLLNLVVRGLNLSDNDAFIPGGRYHNFKDFMNFPDFESKKLKYEPIVPLSHRDIDRQKSLIKIIEERDILIHYPYQSFHYVIDFLREASIDPKVTSIKFTLYRVAKYSSVINALINAVRNGKNVVVVLELQARFDEEANIYWANKLKDEGVKVIYGVPGLKVHSKLCLVTRKKKGGVSRYAIIGTGNYNENTARIYSDHSLFTADKRLTGDVSKIFDFFENNYNLSPFKNLIVAPFDLRKKLNKFIKNEIRHAQEGREAYIFLKVNNLVDAKIIRHLYAASQAGVKIKLIVRSMFSLIPGIPEMSENIKAISIVDKFLEHSRILVFCNGGIEKVFITSADIMPRNLDRRIEVTCPIYSEEIKQELKKFLDIQWKDNVKARILNEPLDNRFRRRTTTRAFRTQWGIYDFLKKYHD